MAGAAAAVARRARSPGSYTRRVSIGPAPILALLVGGLNASIFMFVRARGGAAMIVVFLAAALGAWAGDATGGRLGVDPIKMGDFHLIAASVVAWAGIGFVEVLAILGPSASTTGERE
jgi:hypothetical protein